MPVRFHCPSCRQFLSIARRKIGTTVNCPRCFLPVQVPSEDEVQPAANATAATDKAAPADDVVFDEVDELLQQVPPRGTAWNQPPTVAPSTMPPSTARPSVAPPQVAATTLTPPTLPTTMAAAMPPASPVPPTTTLPPPLNVAPTTPPTATVAAPSVAPVSTSAAPTHATAPTAMPAIPMGRATVPAAAAPTAAQVRAPESFRSPAPRSSSPPRPMFHPELVMSYLFVHRSAIYLQGVVLLLIAVGAFWAGWVAGNQGWLREHAGDPIARRAIATIVVKGSVTYETKAGRQADTGAAVIALPLGAERKKLPLAGWKGPGGDEPLPDEAAGEIRASGGDVTLVKDDGSFEIVVPQAGEYQLLVISEHGKRPTGQLPNKLHVEEMVEWFASPMSLIGWQLYLWQPQQIDDPPAPIELFFPLTQ